MYIDYKYSAEQMIVKELPEIKETLIKIAKTLEKDKSKDNAEESLTQTEEDKLYEKLWSKLRKNIIKKIEKSDAALHYTTSYMHALQDILTAMQEMEAAICEDN